MKNALKLVVIQLMILSASCAGLPPAPEGKIGIYNQPEHHMVCTSIKDAVDGNPNPPVTIVPEAEINNWVGFDPQTWANIQKYIATLKEIAKKRCQ
jgi:hypothetical protein